jgi:hypothetical protein
VVNLFWVHTAILRQLRLLIACLVLSVAAGPTAGVLETSRAVAVLTTPATSRASDVGSPRVVIRAESNAHALCDVPAAAHLALTTHDAPALAAFERPAPHGPLPLYLMQQRFLL